ncbi:MAG: ankyrin repeat domain-containing protein [Candidatus Riflebacteria bacterium]|nr:ankyrin repeat domain-containing protein [Candidatus Riflebacteria bacterium]
MMPIHCAVNSGNIENVRILLNSRANPNARNSDFETPLHIDARKGYV